MAGGDALRNESNDAISREDVPSSVVQLMQSLPPDVREYYYGNSSFPSTGEDNTKGIVDFIYEASRPSELHNALKKSLYMDFGDNEPLLPTDATKKMSAMEVDLRVVYQAYHLRLPENIWQCCSRCCFAMLAGEYRQADVFAEILRIHRMSELIHNRIERCDENIILNDRRKGIGGSDICFSAPSRVEREPQWLTEKQKAQMQLKNLSKEVLPFLYGQRSAPCGVGPVPRKLCSEAICSLLGVSRNFLYSRKNAANNDYLDGDDLSNIVDSAGVRLREYRRQGKRTGYPDLRDLPNYECGCFQPCFLDVPYMRLFKEYEQFVALSKSQKPRRREHRYLINQMFCPLLNTSVRVCNRALSALYTVSEELIADVRRVINLMCEDPGLENEEAIAECAKGYEDNPRHPMNRVDNATREKIELHLDMVLRADPAASDGENVCRVYSTEINTYEKLRRCIAEHLECDKDADVYLSASTLQRMIKGYLKKQNCRISFNQSDHNACPTCKSLQVSILTFSFDIKSMSSKIDCLEQLPCPITQTQHLQLVTAKSELQTKRYQEAEAIDTLEKHNLRDAKIRNMLKVLIDYFINVERSYREDGYDAPFGWLERPYHAIVTHQDDMTKVDLPCFIRTASSDITRWRYDVNAHVNAVTDESIVFSHEQGSGTKNSSSIMEMILLDHLLRCRGEGIKVVVSDNASVGKNWFSAISFPQYMVDQGLAEIVIMVFLENNHGKWLADMLFGQLQIRRRSSTILSVDGLLSEFESVNRKQGSVRGFAVNLLSCIDFSSLLSSLGYQTTPPKDFNFTKRNIHFATACREGAKNRLPIELKCLTGEMLPDERGMVRICTAAPSSCSQRELPYESRYRDVPAAAAAHSSTYAGIFSPDSNVQNSVLFDPVVDAPLVVSLEKDYTPGGPGVVSNRNMTNVGYNGIVFRKLAACPELHNINNRLVREAWPIGILRFQDGDDCEELVSGSHSLKCAPENWVLRVPLQRFNHPESEILARYPPRNMLNAKYKRGPREPADWVPTATYEEPPVPTIPNTSAYSAMCALQEEFSSLDQSVSILHVLRRVFQSMGDRSHLSDPWLQYPVSLPRLHAVDKYRRDLQIFREREKGHPRAPRSVKQFFKCDSVMDEEAKRIHNESGPNSRKSVSKIKDMLFEQAENEPGRLDKYHFLAAKDLERYAKEMKVFKEVTQRHFDETHGLLPVQRNE